MQDKQSSSDQSYMTTRSDWKPTGDLNKKDGSLQGSESGEKKPMTNYFLTMKC